MGRNRKGVTRRIDRSPRLLSWSLCWLLLLAAGCAEVDPQAEPSSDGSQETMPAALRAGWIQRVQNDAGPDYAIARTGAREFEARHPRQNLRTRFNSNSVELAGRDGGAPLRMALSQINGHDPGVVTVSNEGNRVTMSRSGIDEWYVHGPMGLEQGFTIRALPKANGATNDSLRLDLTIEGDYTPTKRGDVIVWNSPERTLETRELFAFDADGKQLSASMQASSGELSIEVDVADARYPIVIDPIWMEQEKLIASTASALGWFGHSISVFGDTAVIGMPRDGDNGTDSGSAYVFFRNGTIWETQQKLLPSDGAPGDQFGISVSLDADTAVIGAYRGDRNATDSGSAYVFVRNGSAWTEQQRLAASDAGTDDQFGYSTSVSGDTVVIGARYDTDNGLFSGSAYVFVRSGTVWSEQQKLLAPDGVSGDHFASAVSVSADTLLIGAFQDDDNGTDSGSAYVFVRSGSVWSQEQKLLASDGATVDRFGFSVIVESDTAVIGAPFDDDNGSGSGSAYVFVRSGGVWTEQQKFSASDGDVDDQFGHSVGLSGDSAVIGARLDDDGASASGSAYVFVRSGTVWSEQQKLLASGIASQTFGSSVSISGDVIVGGAPLGVRPGIGYLYERVGTVWSAEQKLGADSVGPSDEFFGSSVSISGDTAVIGAPSYDDGANTDSGAAYVFIRSGTTWTEQQELRSSDLAPGDEFGSSVSISGDTVLVGARWDDDNGFFSGSAYVFTRSGTVWTEQQKLTASTGVAGDWFGYSVSLSGDTAVVGALLHDGAGSSSGAAYVFVRSGTVWTEQQELLASDGAADDQFGTSVSVSVDTTVIGAVLDDDSGDGSGSAYVFTRIGTVWTEEQKLVPLDGAVDDRFGTAVGVSGDTTVIGARWDDDIGGNGGSAYVFVRSAGAWTEEQQLFASDGHPNHWFGNAVSVDGDAIVVGTWHDTDFGVDSGSAYVFVRSGTVWTEQDKLLASDGEPGDRFGWAVGISGDTALVGAREDDDRGPGAGAAYVFVLMLENGDLCSFDSECLSAFCDPVNLVCACDEAADCLITQVCDTSEAPNACEAANSCGNGVVETGEACDDGGTIGGDGCSTTCFVDNLPIGSDCTNGGNAACASGVCDAAETPDRCEPPNTCGNGLVEAGEVCDDGNGTSGDGCSATCFVDGLPNGADCSVNGAAACASGVCDMTETPATCEAANSCGNGLVEAGEACDDGNGTSSDGCSASCFVDSLPIGSNCTNGGNAACAVGVCDTTETPPTCEPANLCGNGVFEAGELCDDGNGTSGDGCSASCFVDNLPNGVDCSVNGAAACASGVCDLTKTPATCEAANSCGNGAVESGEACDDGGTVPGDGCSATCFVEQQTDGSDCTIGGNAACASGLCDRTETPNTCEAANSCGNSVVEGSEVCDDGNTKSGDGCDAECVLELGAGPCTDGAQCASGVCNTLAAAPVCAVPVGCGNGVVDLGEDCDDGNQIGGDGCAESCNLENGWRGGGGCAASSPSDSRDQGWVLVLLLVGLVRWRRHRPVRKLEEDVTV